MTEPPPPTRKFDALAGNAAVGAVKTVRRRSGGETTRQWLGNAFAAVLVLTAATVGWSAWRTSKETSSPTGRPAVASQVGHVGVRVRGGTPRLIIDDAEVAVSTPAIVAVAPGRHVVRVEEPGRQYVPRQFVIDVTLGDTNMLQFADPRVAGRDAPTPPAADARPALFGRSSTHPYFVDDGLWRQMSPQEQATLRMNWGRLSADQKRKVRRDVLVRGDSLRQNLPRMPFR